MLDLAIVGGGPGGLMSAWYLKKKLGDLCRVTLFEASDRLGGKIVTRKFDSAPAMYEAGVAEIYDYSMTGPDPLRELIQHFGLQTIPMDAEQVQLDGELLNDVPGMRRKYGAKTADAIEAFRKRCASMVSPIEYYEGVGAHDNEHPWAYITAEELLEKEVRDPVAKRFFKVMARSDIATEPHNTNGLNALKNFVMDVDGYIGLYSIQNGNEQLIGCLQSEVNADIQLNHRVLKVGKTAAGRYQLNMMNGKGPETRDFDLVVMCLPHSWLATMRWDGEQLRKSMVKHVAYFDRPAHYLRVSILFDTTLDCLLDSSDAASDIMVTEMIKLRHARRQDGNATSDKIDRDYFENYRGQGPYREVWSRFTDPDYLTELIRIVWNRTKGYK